MHIKNKHQRLKTKKKRKEKKKNEKKKEKKKKKKKEKKQQQKQQQNNNKKKRRRRLIRVHLNLEQEVSASVLKQDPSIYKFKDNAIYFDKREHVKCRGNPT